MSTSDAINHGNSSKAIRNDELADHFSMHISDASLDEVTFLELAQRSGWHRMTSNALQEEKRRPHVLNPTPLVITIRDQEGRVIAARGGMNFGAYAYGQYAMVAEDYQGQGLGTLLLKRFQAELNRINGGDTSIAIFAHPDSQTYYQRRGFTPLKNAYVLKRGTSVGCLQKN